MDEPVRYQNQRVETTVSDSPAAPVAAAPTSRAATAVPVPAPATQRVVSTSSTAIPTAYRARQAVWLALAIVVIILASRFLFYAFGANNVGFAAAMYSIGSALDAPFRGIFSSTLDPSGHPLQWADALAVAVYTVAAWVVNKVVLIASTRDRAASPY